MEFLQSGAQAFILGFILLVAFVAAVSFIDIRKSNKEGE